MATSVESELSKKFITSQIKMYGKDLYIEKRMSNLKVGEPDIFILYKGMPLFAESKVINSITLINNREFTEIQLYNLEQKANAGAMCIGLLLHPKEIKYIMYNKLIPATTKQMFENAEIFNLETLREIWIKTI